jgi:hypothetical protein
VRPIASRGVPTPEPVRPVYDGPGLASLVPALLGIDDGSWLPEPVRDARTVMLLVADGLGWDAVSATPSPLPTLAGFVGGSITSVAPSTTAAALTSISTGTAPSEHGLLGYRIRVDGRILNALSWHYDGNRPPDPAMVQRRDPFRNRSVPILTKSEFRRTGFTEAHLRGGQFFGWRAVSELVEHARRLAAAGERFIYSYYPGVDEVAHAHGLLDGYYAAELAYVDRLVGDLLDVLPSSAALLVTADHGQVHLEPEGWLQLGPFGDLVDACSGDGRFRYLHARRGAAAELVAAAGEEHGAHAWVRSREALLDEGWLGPPPSGQILGRVGDVVIAPHEPIAVVDPLLPREAGLRSAHGSLTAAEMHVPLVAARGRGPG